MTQQFTHETYLSPFTWRYGSDEMRHVWSEVHKRQVWRQLWVALAEAEQAAGLVSQAQVEDLRAHASQINAERALEIEAEIHHDLMAEVKTFAEQCPIGGGIIHLGATSMDIEDNADALRLRESLDLILARLAGLLAELATQIEHWADTPVIAFTHLQPAEPTTLGYRLAQYGFDLQTDLTEIQRARDNIRGKGFKGAVGTSASYQDLLAPPTTDDRPPTAESSRSRPHASPSASQLEARIMAAINLEPFPVATQTYPRKQDWLVLNSLAGVAGSLYKFAFDLRLLQAPSLGELAEPFGRKQVGSSAMPFKRNPINAENIDSLARFVATLPRVAWDNAAHSLLERTLDDSANRREILPAAFLATDEMLRRATRLVRNLRVDEAALARNLEKYGIFAATERVLLAAAKAGADRQKMHEIIREHSLAAWTELSAGQANPLAGRLSTDARITRHLAPAEVLGLLDATQYVGDAPERARKLAAQIRAAIRGYKIEDRKA
ncbi:MAG: adenylosuccinate lyase [Anaerolineales bacterium]|nr:adenylosuccinate lyase [Anaerolineales bacterium]